MTRASFIRRRCAGERDPVNFGGTGVKNLQQDALPLFDPERLTKSHALPFMVATS
jgi:hypothetical protein